MKALLEVTAATLYVGPEATGHGRPFDAAIHVAGNAGHAVMKGLCTAERLTRHHFRAALDEMRSSPYFTSMEWDHENPGAEKINRRMDLT